jgi:hypothetical protein
MSRRVTVHHFVVAGLARPQDPNWRACDLFSVSHWRDVPADTEFPFRVPRMDVFARFYLTRARPTEFRIRVVWLHPPDDLPRVLGYFGPFVVPFARDASARDCSFNLHNLRLQGVGVHRVELLRERTRGFKTGQVVRVAKTYFVVER